MDVNQSSPLYKKPSFLIGLILAVFFIKGLLLVALIPIFQAPDELTHYIRNQYNSAQEKNKPITSEMTPDIQAVSEEVTKTESIIRSQSIAGRSSAKESFGNSFYGNGEQEIMSSQWKQYTNVNPRRAPDYGPFYYRMTAAVENSLSGFNIFIRFFSIRIFSLILGMLIVYLTYLISRTIGFSEKNSLLATAIISFQPMLSATAAIINPDILLILCFTLFLYAGVKLLKNGFDYRHALLLIFAAIAGTYTKGPGITLVIVAYFLLAYLLYREKFVGNAKKFIIGFLIVSLLLLALAYLVVPHSLLVQFTQFGQPSKHSSLWQSLQAYLNKSLTPSHFKFSNMTYWGNFGSLDNSISDSILKIILVIEKIAALGILLLFLPWFKKRDFLPEKKYLIFFIFSIIALQFSIRFFDWRIFDIGGYIAISTPGRYFLPNITAHMILILTGLGWFCEKNEYFVALLKLVFMLMVGLLIYSIFAVIIPRYYF